MIHKIKMLSLLKRILRELIFGGFNKNFIIIINNENGKGRIKEKVLK
jgi:hypothetical protein